VKCYSVYKGDDVLGILGCINNGVVALNYSIANFNTVKELAFKNGGGVIVDLSFPAPHNIRLAPAN